MRWIALLFVLFTGCASTKVNFTIRNGEPVVSVEFVKGENREKVSAHCGAERDRLGLHASGR